MEDCDDGGPIPAITSPKGCYPGCKTGNYTGYYCQHNGAWNVTTICPGLCGDDIIIAANKTVASIEQCDDGNTFSGDGCSSTCQLEAGFTCTNVSNPVPTDWATFHSTCTTVCGDGKVMGSETCDDGSNDGIGCASGCMGVAVGYTCTAGSTTTASVCTPLCGDSIIIAPETCDDGNNNSGDGCSSTC